MSLHDNKSKMVRNLVAELLEFYDRTLLALFYQLCLDYHFNEVDSFRYIRERLLKQLAENRDFPDFIELISMYAEHKNINIDEFTHNFSTMRKHYLQ